MANRIIFGPALKLISVGFLSVLLVAHAHSQVKTPDQKDYPVAARDKYKGKPAAPLLSSKRARMYRTVLRQGAKEGPNFAGRYTIVLWGAGLGAFSMAVVDAKSGRVYFPPFETVGNTGFGLPFVDNGNNPAWSNDSRLFAFIGRPDANDKGMGMYVYSFDRGRFRLKYFEKEDEEARKASQEAWEKEIDRRLSSMADIYEVLRKQLAKVYPDVWCNKGREVKYPIPSLDIICTESDLIVSINMDHHSTPDDAEKSIKSELEFSSLNNLQSVNGLGDQGFEADRCSRAWIRFRQGNFYVWMNANLNKEGPDDPNCSNELNVDSKRLADFSKRLALVLANLLSDRNRSTITESSGALKLNRCSVYSSNA